MADPKQHTTFIDASLYELDEELKQVDELLSNAQVLKSFEVAFDPRAEGMGSDFYVSTFFMGSTTMPRTWHSSKAGTGR